MIQKYILPIKTFFEEHFALVINELKSENKIVQAEVGALHKRLDEQKELYEKIVKLEKELNALHGANSKLSEERAAFKDKATSLEESRNSWVSEGEKLREELKAANAYSDELIGKLATQAVKIADAEKEVRHKTLQIERQVTVHEEAIEKLTQAHTEAQERLLNAVKKYDKATIAMLNALLEKKSSVDERAEWERAKEELKNWDRPKKRGRKRQS